MKYKEYDNVRVFAITTNFNVEIEYEINQIGKDYNIVDVKFSTAYNNGLKHFKYSVLVFAQPKQKEG